MKKAMSYETTDTVHVAHQQFGDKTCHIGRHQMSNSTQ